MGKLIFNAQSTPVAPVGENKHTMFVDSCDGKLKIEDYAGNVCELATEKGVVDNNCIIHITNDCCKEAGITFLPASTYCVDKFIVDEGVCLMFCGDGPVLIKANIFCNKGIIDAYGPLSNICYFKDNNYLFNRLYNTFHYSASAPSKTGGKSGMNDNYGGGYCADGNGNGGGVDQAGQGGPMAGGGAGGGLCCGGNGNQDTGIGGCGGDGRMASSGTGTLNAGGGGWGLCGGGNGGCTFGGNSNYGGCYGGNGGNSWYGKGGDGGYGYYGGAGGDSMYGNGGTGGVGNAHLPGKGGDSIYGNGGDGGCTSWCAHGGCGGVGRNGGNGMGAGSYTYANGGNGGNARQGIYGLAIIASDFYNNCILACGGIGGCGGPGATCGTGGKGGDGADGGCVMIYSNNYIECGNVVVNGGGGGLGGAGRTSGARGANGKNGCVTFCPISDYEKSGGCFPIFVCNISVGNGSWTAPFDGCIVLPGQSNYCCYYINGKAICNYAFVRGQSFSYSYSCAAGNACIYCYKYF